MLPFAIYPSIQLWQYNVVSLSSLLVSTSTIKLHAGHLGLFKSSPCHVLNLLRRSSDWLEQSILIITGHFTVTHLLYLFYKVYVHPMNIGWLVVMHRPESNFYYILCSVSILFASVQSTLYLVINFIDWHKPGLAWLN